MFLLVLTKMHGDGPFLGQLAKARHLLEQLLLARQPGQVGEAGSAQGDIEQQRNQMLLLTKTIVDLLDAHLVANGTRQIELADQASKQLQAGDRRENLTGGSKLKTKIVFHQSGELLRVNYAKDYSTLRCLNRLLLRFRVYT